MAGSFLAVLTRELGFSDSLTGVLTSMVSLGCLFQLLSITCRVQRVKKTVVVCTVANQLLFITLYLLPLLRLPPLFVALLLTAYILYYFVFPSTTWLMSQVVERKRGVFTASKEIVSLLNIVYSTVRHLTRQYNKRSGACQCCSFTLNRTNRPYSFSVFRKWWACLFVFSNI